MPVRIMMAWKTLRSRAHIVESSTAKIHNNLLLSQIFYRKLHNNRYFIYHLAATCSGPKQLTTFRYNNIIKEYLLHLGTVILGCFEKQF